MKKSKALFSLMLAVLLVFTSVCALGTAVDTQAASYTNIPAFPITRVYQPDYDTNGLCYWSSVATVQGYCLGTYTYGGITTNYRSPGTDYDYLKRGDAITKYFKDTANGYANNADNLKNYPVPMVRVTDGIGKNAATYQKIYDQLRQGKPVIVYTGTHASVVIAYNGSTTTLQPAGFTVMEIKKDGKWWSNSKSYYDKHANSPQVDSASGSYMSCYVNLESWIAYCGNKVQEICYPKNAVSTDYTFNFNANGGTGTMSSIKVAMGKDVTFPNCTFVKDGYVAVGYNAQRKSDGKWHAVGQGWLTQRDILNNGYEKSLYTNNLSFTMNSSWTNNGGIAGDTFTLYPVWKPLETSLDFYANHSGTNYMMAITKDEFSSYYQSRNQSVYQLSVNDSDRYNGSDTLRITGSKAGDINSNDLLFVTHTNKSPNYNDNAGDNKKMTLSFWAKSSVEGAKMNFRWGYTSDLHSVTLTTQWQYYTLDMSKQTYDGAHMHPFFDKAGTFYINSICLTDEGAAESDGELIDTLTTATYYTGGTYTNLPTPARDGYTFKGWFTSKTGGTQVTSSTPVFEANTAVYARWNKNSGGAIIDNLFALMGDADLSAKVDVRDATEIQKAVAGILTLSSKGAFCANVDGDDGVTIKDATAIQKWLANIATNGEINVKKIYVPGLN